MPPTPFGPSWDDIDLAAIQAFLTQVDEEGLTWEGKSDDREPLRPTQIHKAVCGFANSEAGGYLLLGVEGGQGLPWTAPGLHNPPAPEIQPWLDNIIRTGVNPVPPFEIKSWSAPGRGPVAIVQVRSVSVPPCITASGVVYERTSGQTLPVRDATRLGSLYTRGQAARVSAETRAAVARDRWFNDPPVGDMTHTQIIIGASATGLPMDISSRLFTEAFAETIRDRLVARLPLQFLGRSHPPAIQPRQDHVSAFSLNSSGDEASWATVHWDGSVAAAYWTNQWSHLESLIRGEYILRITSLASELLSDLGTTGATHLHLLTRDHDTNFYSAQRWAESGALLPDELESIYREFRRALGRPAWEPVEG